MCKVKRKLKKIGIAVCNVAGRNDNILTIKDESCHIMQIMIECKKKNFRFWKKTLDKCVCFAVCYISRDR